MSVIQKIQEKYAKLMAVIIAIALITFVVMLAFENGGNLFSSSSNSSTVGKVNGKTIEYNAFQKKVDQAQKALEAQYAQYAQYGGAIPPGLGQQAIEQAWNQEVNEILQKEELERLGIEVGKKEMGDILYGPNAPEELKRGFTDTTTGQYNGLAAKQYIDQKLKLRRGTPEQMLEREGLIAGINSLEFARLTEKYNSLFSNSVNIPKWFIEKENADKSQIARISFTKDTYAANTDSTVKVSDKEIEEYINKNKKEYKQPESRSIAYVTFSALPSTADSTTARNKVEVLKTTFDTTKDLKKFLTLQGATTFYDGHLNGPKIQVPFKDSIFKMPIGSVYGPYLDGNNYSLAKLLSTRQQPDTANVRHILIATSQQDQQTGQMYPVRDSAAAKKTIDSIQTAIRNGANFDSLCAKLSEDPGSKDKGGLYEKIEPVQPGGMVPEFNDFIFGNPVGTKGVVKTDFGYHYIEILSQKGSSPAYKIAYISKPIEISRETENNAQSEASLFAGDSRDQKSFDANAEKLKAKGINKNIAANIIPTAHQIDGLGVKRSFVKSIYKAKLGEVVFDPNDKVGDNYVVAVVTEINEEGTMPASKARLSVEQELKNRKIAEKLKQKVGTITTLEAAAASLGGKPIEIADSLRMTGAQTAASARSFGAEPRVVGAAFNPANRGKIVPQVIEGKSGVYVIRVEEVSATPLAEAAVAEQRKSRYQQAKQTARSPLQALREGANIKDRRSEIF